jgi:putative membrane protein
VVVVDSAAAASEVEAGADSAAAADRSGAAAPRGAGDVLSEDDHKRIDAAIQSVERKTWGDIYCIVAHEASNYREVPLAWGAAIALLVPPFALVVGVSPDRLSAMVGSWRIAQASYQPHEIVLVLSIYALAQAVLFAATTLLVSIPAVRRLATPHFLKRHRALNLARQHFVSTGLHLAPGQPHVLVFLALMERRVEILAGADVHRMAGDRAWNEASAAIASAMKRGDPSSGIVRAIEIAGAPLIEHFPATRQEQPQGVAEI